MNPPQCAVRRPKRPRGRRPKCRRWRLPRAALPHGRGSPDGTPGDSSTRHPTRCVRDGERPGHQVGRDREFSAQGRTTHRYVSKAHRSLKMSKLRIRRFFRRMSYALRGVLRREKEPRRRQRWIIPRVNDTFTYVHRTGAALPCSDECAECVHAHVFGSKVGRDAPHAKKVANGTWRHHMIAMVGSRPGSQRCNPWKGGAVCEFSWNVHGADERYQDLEPDSEGPLPEGTAVKRASQTPWNSGPNRDRARVARIEEGDLGPGETERHHGDVQFGSCEMRVERQRELEATPHAIQGGRR